MGKAFGEIQLGTSSVLKRVITAKDMDACYKLAGVYGAPMEKDAGGHAVIIGDRVAHGGIAIGMAAELLGSWLMGPGTKLVSIDARFFDAIRLGDTVAVKAEVVDKQIKGQFVSVALSFLNQNNVEVASGAVTIQVTPAG